MSSITPSSSVSNVLNQVGSDVDVDLVMPLPGQSPEYYRACEAYYRAVAGSQLGSVSAMSSTSGASRRRRAKERRRKASLDQSKPECSDSSLRSAAVVLGYQALFKPEYRDASVAIFGDNVGLSDLAALPVRLFRDDWALWCVEKSVDRDKNCFQLSTTGVTLPKLFAIYTSVPGYLGIPLPDAQSRADMNEHGLSYESKLVTSSSGADTVEGYCYLQMFPQGLRTFAFDVGPWPFLYVLAKHVSDNRVILDWSGFDVLRVDKNKLHFVPKGTGDAQLSSQFIHYLQAIPSGRYMASSFSYFLVGGKGKAKAPISLKRERDVTVRDSAGLCRVDEHGSGLVRMGSSSQPGPSVASSDDLLHYYNEALMCLAGKEGHRLDFDRLTLLSKSAALLDTVDKRSMKVLEAVGDAALTLAIASKCSREFRTTQEYQTARSAITSNSTLSSAYVDNGLDKYVTFVAGVSPGQGNVGAYMLEAILGTLYEVHGIDSVDMACRVLGLYDRFCWS